MQWSMLLSDRRSHSSLEPYQASGLRMLKAQTKLAYRSPDVICSEFTAHHAPDFCVGRR